MSNKTDETASKFLGKKVDSAEFYDPSFLVAIPRFENREQYGIKNNALPFAGVDIWHAYEFSAMTRNGLPVTSLMKMKYDCDNEFLVESKSLKLYLNSFNMSRFGKNRQECLDICKQKIEKDLTEKLKTSVEINFISNNAKREEIFSDYVNLLDYVDENSLKIENFKESPELLKTEEAPAEQKRYLTFDSLRSNCRVTHQPDFGDIFIYYKSSKHIKEESLVKYLCSFRAEYHFHEECVEMIYKRLFDLLNKGDELFVCALYTRRGGIDICPARWSENVEIDDVRRLADLNKYARHGIKQ